MSSAVPVLTAPRTTADHPIGVTLGVGHPEHRPPGDPEDDPALDAEVLADPLDVADVVVHVDARPVHALLAGVRRAPSGGALVEQHGPMPLGVEVAAGPGRAARARPPWRYTTGVPLGLPTCST